MEPAFRLETAPEPESGIQLKVPVRVAPEPAGAPVSRRLSHALDVSVSLILVLATLVLTGAWFARFVPSGTRASSNLHFRD